MEREEERRRQATEKWLEMNALPPTMISRENMSWMSHFLTRFSLRLLMSLQRNWESSWLGTHEGFLNLTHILDMFNFEE